MFSSRGSSFQSPIKGGGLGVGDGVGDGGGGGPIKATLRSGLSWKMTAYFLIAQMAGAGFLSLPMALNNTGSCMIK